MASGGINQWTSPRKLGGISQVSTRFSLCVENDQTDAGRNCQGTKLPSPSQETKLSGANGDREIRIFPVQLTTSRFGNLTRMIHTLMTTHTYILHLNIQHYRYMVTHIARVWINPVRLPILLVVSRTGKMSIFLSESEYLPVLVCA